MASRSGLTIVQPTTLQRYPIAAGTALDHLGSIAWEFRQYLQSDLRLNASHEIKGIWFDLVQMAQEQTPVGTLPNDHVRLARMLQPPLAPEHFDDLQSRRFGILHGWHECLCDDGTIRLMHPEVTRALIEHIKCGRCRFHFRSKRSKQDVL